MSPLLQERELPEPVSDLDPVSGDEASELVDSLTGYLSDHSAATHADLVEWVRSTSPLVDGSMLSRCVERALQRATGFGPIADFLEDPDLTEIMINGAGRVWVDRSTGLMPTTTHVSTNDIGLLIERILDPLGLRVDRVSPMVDARLPDGSRVNIVVPPLAVDGPTITIRRFAARAVPLESFGPVEAISILHDAVDRRASILVIGGTGTGKTTMLNALGTRIDPNERIIVVEDTSELRFTGDHIVRLEARPANSEGIGEVTLRQLVRNALRMRPDRLVIGEVRGGEALDLLLALNTGHDGSLATLHANDPAAGLRRLETLCLLGGIDLPLAAIRDQIGSAIDIIVHLERDVDGTRLVGSIAEVDGGSQPEARIVWSR